MQGWTTSASEILRRNENVIDIWSPGEDQSGNCDELVSKRLELEP